MVALQITYSASNICMMVSYNVNNNSFSAKRKVLKLALFDS